VDSPTECKHISYVKYTLMVIFVHIESQVTSDCYDERPDCSKITDMNPSRLAFENYCLFWKNDAAVKQCRKTCQFCKSF